jgi:hypothetical protein
MTPRARLARIRARILTVATRWAARIFLAALFGTAALAVVLGTAVHHTSQPPFCNSCHLMEPYYASWQASSHADVACIECHFEPGSIETLEGKFKALSQLAKYVTRTAGTKPWAEVADSSCQRTGCHSARLLEGPVAFGEIKFDHRQHLLESRPGRRLRCTSCHSQNDVGNHMSVAESVCFTCHFMPGDGGAPSAATGDCTVCHRPPEDELLVDGRPFRHAEYVARGVDCRECHDPVIEGEGTVRRERCQSCHGEIELVERIGETVFLHETHVVAHKVECYQCHDEIHHGLLPLDAAVAPAESEGCGSCHADVHDAARQLYSGVGAVGIPESPSRMHRTRVVCDACHTGRSEPAAGGDELPPHVARVFGDGGGGAHGAHGLGRLVAAAGNVDCIHCHGPTFDGMLGEWQASVGEQLERLRPVFDELRPLVEARGSGDAAAEPLRDAERNFALVALDGSRGAHNVSYALDALRVAAQRLDRVRELLGAPAETSLESGSPFRSRHDCGACHSGVGRGSEVSAAERAFPHASHLSAGLDCDSCHSIEEHGKPSFPRDQCATCHHQESEAFDASDCASCHGAQESLLRGTVALLGEPAPGPKSEMECGECHGEAPAILRPKPKMCVLCHEDGYDDTMRAWQVEVAAGVEAVERAIDVARRAGVDAARIARAEELLRAVTADGSGGVHHFELTKSLLARARSALDEG